MLLLQILREPGDAEHPVAFATEILRRTPALLAGGEEPHKLPDRLDIFIHPKKLLGLFTLRRAAQARAHGIDKDEVARVEDRVWIVHHLRDRSRREPLRRQIEPARPEAPEVQPHRRRTRTAIEKESDRARIGVLGREPFALRVGRGVVNVKDARPRRAIILQHRDRPGLRHVTHLDSTEGHLPSVFLGLFLLQLLVLFRLLLLIGGLFVFWFGGLLLRESDGGERAEGGDQYGVERFHSGGR